MSQEQPLRVCVFGYFDRGNVGDNAMRDAFRGYLAERYPELTIDWRPLPEWSPRHSLQILKFMQMMASADIVLLLGGTHFHDAFGSRSHRILASFTGAFTVARLCRTKIGLVGIGVGPLHTRVGRFLTRLNVGLSSAVFVRDHESMNLLTRIHACEGVICGFDIASLLPLPESAPAEAGTTVGISIVPYFQSFRGDRSKDDEFVRRLADDLRTAHDSGSIDAVKIMIFADSSVDGDRDISNRLLTQLQGRVPATLVYCLEPEVAFREVASVTWMMASRFHAVMFGYLLKKPMIAIPYQPKCLALIHEIELDAGAVASPEEVLDGTRLGDALQRIATDHAGFQAAVPVEASRHRSRQALDRFMGPFFAASAQAVEASSPALSEEPAIEA